MSDKQLFSPVIDYLEIPVALGCNLKCRACSHFSNLTSTNQLSDLTMFKRDLRRLQEILPNIHMIRLLGGEPLLHPKLEQFLCTTRTYYSEAEIHIVTNGLLLPEASDSLLETIKVLDIGIDISLYPPTLLKRDQIDALLNAWGIRYCYTPPIVEFRRRMNLLGNGDIEKNFQTCVVGKQCHYLYNGKLSACPAPSVITIFNDFYGFEIDGSRDLLDLHDPTLTGLTAAAFLRKPLEMCRFCAEPEFLKWEGSSKPQMSDWLVQNGSLVN